MKRVLLLLLAAWATCLPVVRAVDVVFSGGVALKSWEHYRGPSAHDNWWANFIRAATVRMAMIRQERAQAAITWIVYRPAYLTRSREEGKDLIPMIRDLAEKYKAKLVFVDTADQAYAAINASPRGKERVTSFYYFGHSNAHAWMLDYSNGIIGASCQWIHEKDLSTRIDRRIFSPDADCRSFGCYTGQSMSREWKKAFGLSLWGNTESTRYQPVGDGRLPVGAGRWVH